MKARPLVARLRLEELESRVVPSSFASTNWSGYAVSSGAGTVTAVSGSWVVPTIVPKSNNGYSSAWVGIDGYSSNSVEQLGTDSDMIGGTPQYYAWYEVYPNPSHTISTLKINPGDTISASVTYSGSSFVLKIADGANSFTTTQSYPSAQRSSAEWIQEAPSSGSILPLADFGTINFSSAQATISTINGGNPAPINAVPSDVAEITMVTNSGTVKASPSSLTSSGSGFSVTWKSSGSSSGHGGGKQPMVSVPPPSPTSPAVLNDLALSAFLTFGPTPQAAAVAPSSAAPFASAPISQAVPFSPASTAPANSPQSSTTALVGGDDSPTLMPQALPDNSDPNNQPAPKADPDKAPPPAALPTPAGDSKDNVQASAPNQQSSAAEPTSVLISESEEEPSTVGG